MQRLLSHMFPSFMVRTSPLSLNLARANMKTGQVNPGWNAWLVLPFFDWMKEREPGTAADTWESQRMDNSASISSTAQHQTFLPSRQTWIPSRVMASLRVAGSNNEYFEKCVASNLWNLPRKICQDRESPKLAARHGAFPRHWNTGSGMPLLWFVIRTVFVLAAAFLPQNLTELWRYVTKIVTIPACRMQARVPLCRQMLTVESKAWFLDSLAYFLPHIQNCDVHNLKRTVASRHVQISCTKNTPQHLSNFDKNAVSFVQGQATASGSVTPLTFSPVTDGGIIATPHSDCPHSGTSTSDSTSRALCIISGAAAFRLPVSHHGGRAWKQPTCPYDLYRKLLAIVTGHREARLSRGGSPHETRRPT